MRAERILLLGLTLLAACSSSIQPAGFSQQEGANPSLQGKDSDEAARKSLEFFRQLVRDDNFRALGFESRSEAAEAQLSNPLRVSLVPLDQLRNYERGSDPQNLLVEANRMIYPVTVKGQVRSSIVVTRMGENWQGGSFGDAALAKLLTSTRKSQSDFVVWVPALNVYFVASLTNNRLVLIPVLDHPNLGLKVGSPYPAEDAFLALVPAARSYDGSPN